MSLTVLYVQYLKVVMFWMVDSLLMRKKESAGASKMPTVHYHRPEVKYDQLECQEETQSETELVITQAPPTTRSHFRTTTRWDNDIYGRPNHS